MPSSFPAPRKHTVPTHLNLPDQVLTLWSFTLTARQLLLLLVGGGLAGDCWHELAVFGRVALLGQGVRLLCALVPLLVALVVAYYRCAGRYLEVWCIVLVRYWLRPRLYVWRSMRTCEPYLSSSVADRNAPDEEDAIPGTRVAPITTDGTHTSLAGKEAR
jgi:hypothetical protein